MKPFASFNTQLASILARLRYLAVVIYSIYPCNSGFSGVEI